MKQKSDNAFYKVFSKFSKAMIFVAISTLLFHCLIVLVTMYLNGDLTKSNFFENIFSHVYSLKMLPVLLSYGLLFTAVFYYYKRTKNAIHILNRNEIKDEKMKTFLHTSQVTTGILIDNIHTCNADIKRWILEKKQRGEMSPEVIVQASRKLEMSLDSLSKRFFLDPYIDNKISDPEDYTKTLERNMKGIHDE